MCSWCLNTSKPFAEQATIAIESIRQQLIPSLRRTHSFVVFLHSQQADTCGKQTASPRHSVTSRDRRW